MHEKAIKYNIMILTYFKKEKHDIQDLFTTLSQLIHIDKFFSENASITHLKNHILKNQNASR